MPPVLRKLKMLVYPIGQSITGTQFENVRILFQFISVVDQVSKGMTPNELLQVFCDEGLSNYLVVYLRLITSCYLQKNADFFQNFIDENQTLQDFCKGVSSSYCV